MPTAKKYMNYDHDAPYMENGRMYVNILTGENRYTGTLYTKKVRWYSDAEWARMYKDDTPKQTVSYKTILGFGDAGYITIYYGDTYPNLSWFKERPECRYSKIFGWYTPSNEEVSNEIPYGVETARLFWDGICDTEGKVDEAKAEKVVDEIRYSKVDAGEFIDEIGDRGEYDLVIEKAVPLEGYYGSSTMHIMKDDCGNTFVWTTAAKTLEVGKLYRLKGTVKEHKIYRGVKQTVLTRCKVIKELE